MGCPFRGAFQPAESSPHSAPGVYRFMVPQAGWELPLANLAPSSITAAGDSSDTQCTSHRRAQNRLCSACQASWGIPSPPLGRVNLAPLDWPIRTLYSPGYNVWLGGWGCDPTWTTEIGNLGGTTGKKGLSVPCSH